jgi:ubiquinone/menaquinone biosynthesis C-methylase UbiE
MNKYSKKEIQQYANFWKKKLMPEVKPLPSHLNFFENKIREVLEKNKSPKALVLGVTPEIRDVLAKYKIETVCLDMNPLMIAAMNLLVKRKNTKEKIVIGNWLNIPFKDNFFDFIISDCPHDNLPYGNLNKFFGSVNKVLKRDGYFLLASSHFKGRKEGINFLDFVKIYQKDKSNFKKFKCYHILRLTSSKDFYSSKSKIADWIAIDKIIRDYYKQGRISKNEYEDMRISADELNLTLASRFIWIAKEDFLSIMGKNKFYLLGWLEDDEYPGGYFKQAYIFKKIK